MRGRSAGRTGPDEGNRRRDAAPGIAGWCIALFRGIPGNVDAIVAIEDVKHLGT